MIAERVDKAIFNGYKIFPNQVLAAEWLGLKNLTSFAADIEVSDQDREVFSTRLKKVIEEVGNEVGDEEAISKIFCEVMVQPLLAKFKVSQ